MDSFQLDNLNMVVSFPSTSRTTDFSPIFLITLTPEGGYFDLTGLKVAGKTENTNAITKGIYDSFILASQILGFKGTMTLT
jgi:hypothetical protein